MRLSEPGTGARFRGAQAADESAQNATDNDAESCAGDARPRFARGLGEEDDVNLRGEFAQGGRDHFQRMSVAFAGGGVRGGRAVGVTDATANKVVDFGWSGNRDIRIEDLTCTIYSALGIDYTTVLHNDPIGRGYEYVPFAKDGVYKPVDEIF